MIDVWLCPNRPKEPAALIYDTSIRSYTNQGTPSIAGRPLLSICGNSPLAELFVRKEIPLTAVRTASYLKKPDQKLYYDTAHQNGSLIGAEENVRFDAKLS